MQRVALINGTNKNQDYDLAKIFSSISTSGVVEGLEVQSGKVTPGHAFVDVVRDGITFPILFTNTQDVIIDTSGDKKVFIEITQANIDDGSGNSSNGTGIGEIKTAISYPTLNYVKLASITGGVITDEREFIELKNASLTKQGNTFNAPGKLLKIGADGKLPSIDGSNLTGIKSEVSSFIEKGIIAGEDMNTLNVYRAGNPNIGEDPSKYYKSLANDNNKLYFDGIVKDNVLIGGNFTGIFDGVVSGFDNLIGNIGISNTDITKTISNYDNNNYYGSFISSYQTFTTPGNPIKLNSIDLNFREGGAYNQIKVSIQTNDGITELASKNRTVSNSGMQGWVNWDMGGIILEANTVYRINIERVSGSRNIQVYRSNITTYSGGSWNIDNDYDLSSKYNYNNGYITKKGSPIYLQDDGSLGYNQGLNQIMVGNIFSNTEIKIIGNTGSGVNTYATTGSVVLGNAEGYLTINIPGVGNKKIPYYGI